MKLDFLVSVMVWLVWTILRDAKIIRLFGGKFGQLDVKSSNMREGDLFIQLLGKHVDTHGVLGGVAPELNLGQDLVGEGAGHDKAGVTHGTAKVDKTTLSEKDDVLSVLEGVSVDLGLDVGLELTVLLQPLDLGRKVQIKTPRKYFALKYIFCKMLKVYLDLAVKVTNVANNGVVLHLKGNFV